MPGNDRPLSPSDRQALWAWLAGRAAPAGGLGPEALDGFFTALVIGPETVPPSQYLRAILGSAAFASEAEARRVFDLLMRHWNHLAKTFMEDRMPKLWLLDTAKDRKGTGWSRGFMLGVSFCEDAWKPALDHPRLGTAFRVIQDLAGPLEGPAPALSRGDRDACLTLLRDGLMELHRHWLEARRNEAGILHVSQVPR